MRPLIFDMLFKDDRMFVLEIAPVTASSPTSISPAKREWAVITRRNVPGYPPSRCDTFPTREEALAYFKRVVVETPRVSLDNQPPAPAPALEQYTSWLKSEDLYDPILNPDGKHPDN